MSTAIVTARVTEEQKSRIDQLVDDGIFSNRSAVIHAFVELGLEHCNLGGDAWTIKQVSAQFRTKAQEATKRATVHSLVEFITVELSNLIETQDCHGIIDCLTSVRKAMTQLPPDIEDQFIEALGKKAIFKVACQMIHGDPLMKIEECWKE